MEEARRIVVFSENGKQTKASKMELAIDYFGSRCLGTSSRCGGNI